MYSRGNSKRRFRPLLSANPALYSDRRMTPMAFKITDECIKCGACADECPVSAITEGDDKYVIDADTCIGCGNCAATCPVGAPVEE